MNKEKHKIRKERLNSDLQPRHMHCDADTKLRILHLVESGVHIEVVAKSFDISSRSIYNWQDAYDKDGLTGLESAPRSGRNTFVSDKDVKKCIEDIQGKELLTVRRLHARIAEKFGVWYAESSIRYIFDKHGLTYKKANPVHGRGATNEGIEEWREENIPRIKKLMDDGHELFAQDEAHSALDSDSRHGYAPCGTRVYATYHGKKQKVGIIGAVGEDGSSLYCTEKVFNQQTFKLFLNEFACMIGDKKAILLLDKAKYHDGLEIRKWFEDHPNIVPIFMPTASPHLNLIENIWAALKRYMSQFVYYDMDRYRQEVLRFLHQYNFSRNIFGKLFSVRPQEANDCIINARKQLAAIIAN